MGDEDTVVELFGDGISCGGGDGALGKVVGGVDPVKSGVRNNMPPPQTYMLTIVHVV